MNKLASKGKNGFIANSSYCLLQSASICKQSYMIHRFVCDIYLVILTSVTEVFCIKSSTYSKVCGMGILRNRDRISTEVRISPSCGETHSKFLKVNANFSDKNY